MQRSAVIGIMVVVAGCASDDGSSLERPECPSTDAAGGTFPVGDGTPGVIVVEIAQADARLVAGFGWGVPDPVLPNDAFEFIAPDRWLRLRVDPSVHVQECRRGGTADGACDEIGPPTGGQLVGYRDGVEIVSLPLYAPSWPIEPVEGCPLLFAGHVD